jgi:hypothetical protein
MQISISKIKLLLTALSVFTIVLSCQKRIENDIIPIDDDPTTDDSVGTSDDFDTSVTRYFSDINTFGLYIGKTGPSDNILDMTTFNRLETLKKDSAVACAKELLGRYFRLNVNREFWYDNPDGKEFFMDFCKITKAANLGGIVNVNYHASDFSTPQPYPTPEEYIPFLKEVLDSMNAIQFRPALIVVENEEANTTQYEIDITTDETMYRDLQKYIDQLAAAVQTCNSYVWWDGKVGVEATNGGFLPRDMNYVVWNWLRDDKDQPELAAYFGQNALSPNQYSQIDQAFMPRFVDVKIKMNKFLTEKMNQIPMKYVNYHWYEPCPMKYWNEELEGGTPADFGIPPDSIAPNVLDLTYLYYHDRMPNKQMISNEIYIINYSVPLFNQFFDKLAEHAFHANNICLFYSADGGNLYFSKGFHNTFPGENIQYSYSLRLTGMELRRRLQLFK